MPVKKTSTKKTNSKKTQSQKQNSSKVNNSTDNVEQFKIYGSELLTKVKELVKEGNIQKIIVKDEKGKVVVEFPMTFAVVGAALSPILAAIGALAALMTKCTLEVQRKK